MYSTDTVVLQECHRGVTGVSQRCNNTVSAQSQDYSDSVSYSTSRQPKNIGSYKTDLATAGQKIVGAVKSSVGVPQNFKNAAK